MTDIAKGYKQTEAGVIPEDWDIATIGEISEVKTGPFGSALHEKDYVNEGTPIITVEHLGELGVLHSNLPQVSDTDRVRLKAYSLWQGDIVFSRVGSVDRNALIKATEDGWLFSGRLLRVRPTRQRIHSPYVSYHFHSETFKQRVRNVAVGQTMASLNTQIFKGVKVVLPPTKAEQEAIAEALSHADALIESLEQLIAKKRHLKQGTMQELLTGKKRLPGFSGEWEVKSLGEIGESLIGLTYKPSDVRADGVLVLRSSNIFEGVLRFEDNVFVQMDIPERIMVRSGDILICVRNGSRDLIGKCAKIDQSPRGITFGAFMAVFRTPFYDFVYHQFQSEVIKRQINEHLGATINQITNKSLNSFRVPFPPDEAERTALAAILSDMDAEIAALEEKLAKARNLKLGMMQELLTGRIRLI